jgi:glycosyltransferase involved in cell wall biosynthesis
MRSCVLLSAPIRHHSRVTRSVRALSRLGPVSLFYLDPTGSDRGLFDDRVRLCPVPRPEREPSFLLKNVRTHRQYHYLADAAIGRGEACDLVLACDLPTLEGGARLAGATGAALVYDSMDLTVETVNQCFPDDARFPRSLGFAALIALARRVQRGVERRLIRRVDLVVTASFGYEEYLVRHYRPRRSHVVLNCPELPDISTPVSLKERLGFADGDRVVLYQGLMNAGRGLRSLVAAAKHLPAGVRLLLIGWGPLEEKLKEIARRDGTGDRVVFAPPVEQRELPAWTAAADLGVLLLEPFNVSKRLSSATKIYEYMAAGIPVLTTDLPGNQVVSGTDAGWLIEDTGPENVARAIGAAFADEDERARRGRNGRRAAEDEYNWARQEERFLLALRPILKSPPVS